MMRIQDMPGPSPAFIFLMSLNAPVAPLLAFSHYLPELLARAFIISIIGFFWYWVALSVEHWRKERAISTFSWKPLRMVTDLLLVADGAIWGFYGLTEELAVRALINGARGPALRNSLAWAYFGWQWWIAFVCFHLGWCFVLIFFFGQDFIQCILHKKTPANIAI